MMPLLRGGQLLYFLNQLSLIKPANRENLSIHDDARGRHDAMLLNQLLALIGKKIKVFNFHFGKLRLYVFL